MPTSMPRALPLWILACALFFPGYPLGRLGPKLQRRTAAPVAAIPDCARPSIPA